MVFMSGQELKIEYIVSLEGKEAFVMVLTSQYLSIYSVFSDRWEFITEPKAQIRV
jgi:hypothetical protein